MKIAFMIVGLLRASYFLKSSGKIPKRFNKRNLHSRPCTPMELYIFSWREIHFSLYISQGHLTFPSWPIWNRSDTYDVSLSPTRLYVNTWMLYACCTICHFLPHTDLAIFFFCSWSVLPFCGDVFLFDCFEACFGWQVSLPRPPPVFLYLDNHCCTFLGLLKSLEVLFLSLFSTLHL